MEYERRAAVVNRVTPQIAAALASSRGRWPGLGWCMRAAEAPSIAGQSVNREDS